MIARVSTTLSADRLFDYAVPDALSGRIRVGQRVRIPFGRREEDGYVIELSGENMPGGVDTPVRDEGPGPSPNPSPSAVQPPRVAPQNTPSSLSAGLRRGQECPRPQTAVQPPRVAPQNTPSSLSAGLRRGQECPHPQQSPRQIPLHFVSPEAAFSSPADWHSRNYLPHFDRQYAVQFVTFRLADSIPASLFSQWRTELQRITGPQAAGTPDVIALQRRVERYTDEGHGSCLLAEPTCAEVVEATLRHDDGRSYRLLAWSVMPNHVHVLIACPEGSALGEIVKLWKGVSSRRINQLRHTQGELWEPEYFDRFIRDEAHYQRTLDYILTNPARSNVCATWTHQSGGVDTPVRDEGPRPSPNPSPSAVQPPRVAPQNTPSSLSAGLRRGQECPRPQLTLFPLPAPEAPALKPILAIEDDIPFLSPALIRLTRWIADYYCAPFEATLRCVMPSSVRDRTTRAKEQLYVYLAEKPPADATLTKRQRELLAELTRLGGGWLAAMLKELACSPETLRTLAAAGAIRIEPRQMRRDPLANRKILPTKPLPLMPEQATALAAVEAAIEAYRVPGDSPARRPILLHGVTGSGKTEVYLQAIARVLADGLDAIVLVPEIALTPQTVQRFAARFGNLIAVLHSALSDGERFDEWHRIRSGEARVVVGPRSAVFAPVHHLGIIIVDEEHEPSYKQDEVPHYSARDVAIMRGIFESCPVVLGTATPSLETWLNVKRGKYAIVRLASRVANRPMPDVRLVDMRLEKDESGRVPLFSRLLLDAIKSRLERGEQVMLFRNRRGYATSLVCPDCGATPTCEFCDLPMTYHEADHCLRCHVCGRWQHVPEKCPTCGSPNLLRRGNGTQRIEDALHKCFPSARILRLDLDITTRKSSHDEVLGEFRSREADILVGTQMIAKGLDFPNVTLVGVLSADSGLNLPDFRAAERTYQLLAQVSGRAGRADLPGEVYIQTFLPDHPAIRAALSETCFPDFADAELAEREHGLYPPYTHAVCLTFRGKQESRVSYYSGLYEKELKAWAAASREVRILVSDSCPAPLPKANGSYRYQILLRAKTAHPLTQLVRSALAVHPLANDVLLAVDVDAINVM